MRISDYAVVYDITSDTERARVDKLLKGFGFRAQKSVFECRLDKRGKQDLIEKLQEINLQTGFIKIYRLEFSSKTDVIGRKEEPGIDDENAFII
jgi:CRISPR-associated protein Cas2